MYIKDLQINGFGNLENKKITLSKGFNVINGKNESGKSTIANFIKGIFYGVNKNKDGNKFSEYEKFKPWADIDFSGKLTYEYEGEEYTVYRDFNRNNSKVYDADGNDITNKFGKDRSRGVEIGLAHLKIDEETFENSFLVKQSSVSVETTEQRAMIQKLTNMIQIGDEGTSYEKTKSRLEKMLLDEVGTERTRNKPKNIVNEEINYNEKKKQELIYNKERCKNIETNMKELKNKEAKIKKDYSDAKRVYDIKKKYEDLLEEKRNAYETAKKIMEKERQEALKEKQKRIVTTSVIIAALSVVLSAVPAILKYYWAIPFPIIIGVLIILLYYKLENREKHTFSELNFDVTKEEINKKRQWELDALERDGVKNSLFERKSEELKTLIDGYEKSKNDIVLEQHKLYLEESSLKESLNKLNEIEENLQVAYSKKSEIDKVEASLKLAISVLEESYQELKKDVMPTITKLIKENVSKTTNGQYNDVIYNDINGMFVENENGELISIDKLSLGTIDQIYLGFRLAIANRIGNIPLILDETFVYYDNERLKNMLDNLLKISGEKQIILLSCSDREINMLKDNECTIISI